MPALPHINRVFGSGGKSLSPPCVLRYSVKGKGEPCEQGETAAQSGCVPVGGEGSRTHELHDVLSGARKPTAEEFGRLLDEGYEWSEEGWTKPTALEKSPVSKEVSEEEHSQAGSQLDKKAKELIALALSWEQTKPWAASEEDIRSGKVPGLRFESRSHGEEGRYFDGEVRLTSKFFQPPMSNHPEARRHLIYHELGHLLADTMVNDGTSFRLHDSGVIPTEHDLGSGTGGGHGDEEALADSFALLHTDPEWLRERHPEMMKIVEDRARALGMPLPSIPERKKPNPPQVKVFGIPSVKSSYFEECDRDEEGHCLPSGENRGDAPDEELDEEEEDEVEEDEPEEEEPEEEEPDDVDEPDPSHADYEAELADWKAGTEELRQEYETEKAAFEKEHAEWQAEKEKLERRHQEDMEKYDRDYEKWDQETDRLKEEYEATVGEREDRVTRREEQILELRFNDLGVDTVNVFDEERNASSLSSLEATNNYSFKPALRPARLQAARDSLEQDAQLFRKHFGSGGTLETKLRQAGASDAEVVWLGGLAEQAANAVSKLGEKWLRATEKHLEVLEEMDSFQVPDEPDEPDDDAPAEAWDEYKKQMARHEALSAKQEKLEAKDEQLSSDADEWAGAVDDLITAWQEKFTEKTSKVQEKIEKRLEKENDKESDIPEPEYPPEPQEPEEPEIADEPEPPEEPDYEDEPEAPAGYRPKEEARDAPSPPEVKSLFTAAGEWLGYSFFKDISNTPAPNKQPANKAPATGNSQPGSARGQPCKRGQSAARTGCIPTVKKPAVRKAPKQADPATEQAGNEKDEAKQRAAAEKEKAKQGKIQEREAAKREKVKKEQEAKRAIDNATLTAYEIDADPDNVTPDQVKAIGDALLTMNMKELNQLKKILNIKAKAGKTGAVEAIKERVMRAVKTPPDDSGVSDESFSFDDDLDEELGRLLSEDEPQQESPAEPAQAPEPKKPEPVVEKPQVKKGSLLPSVDEDKPNESPKERAQRVFKGMKPAAVAKLLGLPKGTKVGSIGDVYEDDHGGWGVLVSPEHRKLDGCLRFIGIDRDGNRFIENKFIEVKEQYQGEGLGTSIFSSQAEQAANEGFKYIATHAAGTPGGMFNGYYTWPRLGYDMTIDEWEKGIGGKKVDAGWIRERFPEARTISDLMQTDEGRKFWKEKGSDLYDAHFDLSEGSRSRQVLSDYLAVKAQKGKANAR